MLLALNACLLTDVEFEASIDKWSKLPDPFPNWIDTAAEEETT